MQHLHHGAMVVKKNEIRFSQVSDVLRVSKVSESADLIMWG
jgi:hypothetical protein